MVIDIKNIILSFILLINLFSFGLANYCISLPLIILLSYFLFINKYKNLKLLFKYSKEIKFLSYFILFAFIGYVFNIKNANLFRFLYSIFVTYISSFILCFIIGAFLPFIYKSKTIIKLMILSLYLILCFGLIEFVLYYMHIGIIDNIINLTSGRISSLAYKVSMLPRIQSFFQEPSHYAWFIVCNIPIAFKIFESKYRIFNDKLINLFIKKTLLPMLLVSLILTQSALNLIFGISVIVIYKLITLKIKLKHIICLGLIGLLLLFTIIRSLDYIDISETYLFRIVKTIQSFGDFNNFINSEPSLATRIISYTNMFIIFFKHSLFGVSCGQLAVALHQQLPYSPLSLTWELNQMMLKTGPTGANPAIFFKVAVDTGLCGITLFYSIIFRLMKRLKRNKMLFYGIKKDFLDGIYLMLFVFIVLTLYDSQITCHYFWILFGCTSGFYYKYYLEQQNIINALGNKKEKFN